MCIKITNNKNQKNFILLNWNAACQGINIILFYFTFFLLDYYFYLGDEAAHLIVHFALFILKETLYD